MHTLKFAWLCLLLLALTLVLPSAAAAQADPAHIATLDIKLWPEYDTPDMLVIYDFQLTADTPLPARVTFRIPIGVSVHAVAAFENGGLMNATYEGPIVTTDWQEVTLLVDKPTSYHFEYYAPILKTGSQRRFNFQWEGEHAVDRLRVSVQQPPTAQAMRGTPALEAAQDTDNLTYHSLQVNGLQFGEPFELVVEYEKNDDSLTLSNPVIQPSAPLDDNAIGRISLNNYVPYLLGGLGVILIASGVGYYFLFARRNPSSESRRRRRASLDEDSVNVTYCPQCGERTRPGDRFCRVCGTRIRQAE